MTTAGQIFKKNRLSKKLTLLDVEKATKIRHKFLEALEEGRFEELPSQTSTRGFVRNYAIFLGLNPEEIQAFYRREVTQKENNLPVHRPFITPRFAFTPRVFMIMGVGALLILFFAYLGGQYLVFTGAPFLYVDRPLDLSTIQQSTVAVVGKSDPETTVAINGQVVSLDVGGNFKIEVPLGPGLNEIAVVSENKYKRQTKIVRRVRLELPVDKGN